MNARMATAAMACAGLVTLVSAQSGPPVQGTIATEGSMKAFYGGVHTIIVTTTDGVEHVYRFTRDLIVHGEKGAGPEALQRVKPGSTVVIHFTRQGTGDIASEVDVVDDELERTEGVLSAIDRGKRQIVVKFANGSTQTFQLTERAAEEHVADVAQAGAESRVIIYFVEENGQKVAHYFRRVS